MHRYLSCLTIAVVIALSGCQKGDQTPPRTTQVPKQTEDKSKDAVGKSEEPDTEETKREPEHADAAEAAQREEDRMAEERQIEIAKEKLAIESQQRRAKADVARAELAIIREEIERIKDIRSETKQRIADKERSLQDSKERFGRMTKEEQQQANRAMDKADKAAEDFSRTGLKKDQIAKFAADEKEEHYAGIAVAKARKAAENVEKGSGFKDRKEAADAHLRDSELRYSQAAGNVRENEAVKVTAQRQSDDDTEFMEEYERLRKQGAESGDSYMLITTVMARRKEDIEQRRTDAGGEALSREERDSIRGLSIQGDEYAHSGDTKDSKARIKETESR